MKTILILTAVLLVGFSFQSVFGQVEKGINFDREIIGVDIGKPIYKWTSKPTRIQDGFDQFNKPIYKNYKLFEDSNYVRLETMNSGSLEFNKNTCSYDFYKIGLIAGQTPNIKNISWTVKGKSASVSNWSTVNAVNSAACSVTVETTETTVRIIGEKSTGVGTFQIVLDYVAGNGIKETMRAYNNNAAWNNHNIGFTETFEVPQIITFGANEYDLSNYNGTVLGRNWIENNKAKIIGFTDDLYYDFGIGFDNLNDVKITWDGSVAKLSLNYLYPTQTVPYQTWFEVDPTLGITGTNYWLETGNSAGASCAAGSVKNTTPTLIVIAEASGVNDKCYATALKFDVTTLPDYADVLSASVTISIASVTNGRTCAVTPITVDPATASAADLWNDILDGSPYVSGSTACQSTGDTVYNLNSQGLTDIELAASGSNSFSIGWKFDDMSRDASKHDIRDQSAPYTQELSITYVAAPNNPTNFVPMSDGRNVSFTWTASSPRSGSQNGVDAYFIGRSLDNSTWTNKTNVGNVTSYYSSTYWRLNQLYYVNITASDTGQTNSTGTFTSFTTDNIPSAPQNPYATGMSSSKIKVNFQPPASDGNDPIVKYKIEGCFTCTSWTVIDNSTTTLNYNHTGLSAGQTWKYRILAWNDVGPSPYSANVTAQTYQTTTGVILMNTTVVGDAFGVTPKMRMTAGNPAATITSSALYRNGTLIDTDTYSQSISNGQTVQLSNQYSNLMNINYIYNHTIVVTITNGTGSTQTFSNSTYERPDYTANYYTMNGFLVNYTHHRENGGSGLNLTVNRDPLTFHLRCQFKTQMFDDGTEIEGSNLGYFNTLQTVPATQNVYVKCYNDALIIDFVSYGQFNGTLAILDYSEELGTFFGVPIIFMPIIFFAALFTGVSAPRGAIFLVAVIGIMGVMGFFPDENGDPLITGATWSLLIFLAVCGLFIGKRWS